MESEQKANILLVDDRKENLLALEAILQDLGQNLVQAKSGKEALRCLLRQDFAVILLDVQMPEMDGLETARLIRKRSRSADIPIIFVTAFSGDSLMFEGYSLGAVDYLLKPIEATILTSKVKVFVELFQKTAALEQQAYDLKAINAKLQASELALRSLNEQLENRVQQRTAELIKINISINKEIQERKRVEEELRQAQAQLEIRVKERTIQLSQANEQLQQELGERLLTEEALRESQERFRSAFEHASSGMALVGMDGRWLKVNPTLCEMLGYSKPELLATTSFAITYPEDIDKGTICGSQLLSGETRSCQIEKRYWHKLGYIIWVLVSVSLVCNAKGEPLYFVTQIQDITERQKIDQMKNEFISVVSHELRTPLASIRGSLGLLASGVLAQKPEASQQMLDIAANNTERLVRLVNDILDLERLESNKVTLNKQWCDAASLIHQSLETLQPLAEENHIILSHSSLEIPICVDPDRIIQTLVNLVSNAIKFSPEKTTITLTAQAQPEQILFQVKDQGRGIPEDCVESIFGRFQQVDASDSRQKNGTGLGLAICRSIVQQHGGKIWAESVLGEGSTFYFTIPISLN